MHLSTLYNVPPSLMDWPGWQFLFTFRPEKHKLDREDVKILLPVKFRWIPFSGFRGKVKICISQSEARAAILFFWISPKNTNLVEDVKNLLSIKFRWISFSGFIREVTNVSANQRTGRPSCFSDQPENRKPGRWCSDLASCQVLLNSIQRFQRKSWKCLSKS